MQTSAALGWDGLSVGSWGGVGGGLDVGGWGWPKCEKISL